MQNILSLFTTADPTNFIDIFIKAFAVLFALLYLIYTIVIARQTTNMNSTFHTDKAPILQAISFLQIIFALILLFVSLVVI